MEPHRPSPWYLHEIPSYAKDSEGYPPVAKSTFATTRYLKASVIFTEWVYPHHANSFSHPITAAVTPLLFAQIRLSIYPSVLPVGASLFFHRLLRYVQFRDNPFIKMVCTF